MENYIGEHLSVLTSAVSHVLNLYQAQVCWTKPEYVKLCSFETTEHK